MRVIIIKDFKQSKLNPVLKVIYQKLLKIVDIIELLEIDIKKYFVLLVNYKGRSNNIKGALKRKGMDLLLNYNYDI